MNEEVVIRSQSYRIIALLAPLTNALHGYRVEGSVPVRITLRIGNKVVQNAVTMQPGSTFTVPANQRINALLSPWGISAGEA